MRATRLVRYDSFKSARGSLAPLFSSFRAATHIEKDVRRFILTRSRHLDRLSRSQQRSWVRANLTLVLQEARKRRNFAVAEAALHVALTERQWIEAVDPVWVKDAAAACRTTEELGQLQALLASLHAGDGGRDGNLVALLLGGSHRARGPRAALGTAAQLGDGDDGQTALSILQEEGGEEGVSSAAAAGRDALANQLSPEERVALALARTTVEAAGNGGGSALTPTQRTVAAMRRIEDQREAATVAPNQSFARYFLRQGIVRTETELMALVDAMRARPARIGFRVHLTHPHGQAAARILQGREGIARVSWLPPAAGAFVVDCTNASALRANRTLLRAMAKERVVSFQSTSSMLPVHLLNPQPGERVLDLCASPGSKTALILDCMAASNATGAADGDGCVCANEADDARARELVGRLQNDSPQVLVTRAAGERFGAKAPLCGGRPDSRQPLWLSAEETSVENYFDKVLVDAPCTGEGRLGRDVMAWRLWHPEHGLNFFPKQVALLRRAVQVCRPGGTIVYATCTLNPIENEAVVAAVLREFSGVVDLVMVPPLQPLTADPSAAKGKGSPSALVTTNADGEAPVLQLDRGLPRWSVPSSAGGFYESAREARAREGDGSASPPSSVFFPTAEDATAASVSPTALGEQLQQCCRRVLPHRNGAGAEGFFVAVLRKAKATAADAAAREGSPPLWREPRAVAAPRAPSVLRARGFTRLPAGHACVQRLLVPFCAAAATATRADPIARILGNDSRVVQRLLADRGWAALWHEGEGLRLASERASALAQALSSGDGEGHGSTARLARRGAGPSSALLDAGVLAFDGAGNITERGAALLRSCVPARVLALPPMYVQLLLANRQLDVAPHGSDEAMGAGDPVASARRRTSNSLVNSGGGDRGAAAWTQRVVLEVGRHGAGNAIVVVQRDENVSSHGEGGWARWAGDWAIPVRAEVLPPPGNGTPEDATVRLHLLLSREAQQRSTAMISRLQGHQQHVPTSQAVREYLQSSEDFDVSGVMAAEALFGAAVSSSSYNAKLFGSPANHAEGGKMTPPTPAPDPAEAASGEHILEF